jgi:hypothetical protein
MNKGLFVVLAIAVGAVMLVGLSMTGEPGAPAANVQTSAGQLSITAGKNHLIASEAGETRTETFLVVGGSGRGTKLFTTHLSVIPLETARRLRQKYGNFRRCGSPGAKAGKKATRSLFLYAADPEVANTLNRVDRSPSSWSDCLIRMRYAKLKVHQHTRKWMGKEVRVKSGKLRPKCLVKDVEILEEKPD